MSILPITGAILAGGKNSRMSSEKSLLTFNDVKLIDKILRTLDSCFNETIVITDKEILKEHLSGRKVYPDIFIQSGALGGIHSALTNARNDAVFIVACDMPNLSKKIVTSLTFYYHHNCDKKLLVLKHSQGLEPLHSIYCKSCLPIIENQLKANKLKISHMYRLFNTDYFEVSDELIHTFQNINTQNDLSLWQEMYS